MKQLLPLAVLLGLLSCRSGREQSPGGKDSAHTAASIGQTEAQAGKPAGTVVANNSSYLTWVPEPLQLFIENELPGYSIPTWDRFPHNRQYFVQPKGPYEAMVEGDFNCDSIQDYAIVLESPAHRVITWAFVGGDNTFSKDTIGFALTLPDSAPIGYQLFIAPLGIFPHLDLDNPKAKPKKLLCPSIQIDIPEKSSRTWYLEGGTWKYLRTSD